MCSTAFPRILPSPKFAGFAMTTPLPDLDTLRAFFSADRFAASAGITLTSANEDAVLCVMQITPEHLNAGGGVQGGAIFTLADFTFAVHANLPFLAGEAAGITVAQSNTISFLAAPKGDRLLARSTCLSRGRNVSVFRVGVFDAEGRQVAEMIGNGVARQSRP